MSIPHGALCVSEICDYGVAVKVLFLLFTAPCVGLKSVIVVLSLCSVPIPHGALCGSDVCDCGVAV